MDLFTALIIIAPQLIKATCLERCDQVRDLAGDGADGAERRPHHHHLQGECPPHGRGHHRRGGGNIQIYPHSVCHGDAEQRIVDDVSRIHIPKNMVPFAENLDQVVLPSPSRGETVLDRCVVELSMNLCEVSQSRRRPLLGPSPC